MTTCKHNNLKVLQMVVYDFHQHYSAHCEDCQQYVWYYKALPTSYFGTK